MPDLQPYVPFGQVGAVIAVVAMFLRALREERVERQRLAETCHQVHSQHSAAITAVLDRATSSIDRCTESHGKVGAQLEASARVMNACAQEMRDLAVRREAAQSH